MDTLVKIIGAVVLALVILLAIALLLTLPTMWLWNWLMPVIFGLKTITFWQALGLNILCGILFRSSTSSKS